MPEQLTYHYIPFTAKGDDSRRLVEGYVSSPAVDCDDQIVDQDWLKAELPDWMLRYGNIREQHNPQRAVGKAQAVDLTAQPGPYLVAKIVDDDAWRKVQAGVYNGFSVGIKAPKLVYDGTAKNGRIAGGKLIEISIVDRPANEAAKFVVLKRAGERGWLGSEGGPVMEEEQGVTDQGQSTATPEAEQTAALPEEAPTGAGRDAYPTPATPVRPAAIGEVMAMLQEVQARIEALAGETDRDRDGDVDTVANTEAAPGTAASAGGAADFVTTHGAPMLAEASPLALTFATEADLTKFIATRVDARLAERGAPAAAEALLTKAALAEPLAAIPEIAKLAGGIAKGLEALAGVSQADHVRLGTLTERADVTTEELGLTKAALAGSQADVIRLDAQMAETQADLARVKELAQPVKGAVFAMEKGIGIEPDRIYRDGVVPESAKRGAEAAKVLAGLSDEERRQVSAAVLSEMYRARS